MLFLSLTYWRDVMARLYSWQEQFTHRFDESPEFVLPINCLVSIVFSIPPVPWDLIMKTQSSFVQSKISVLQELVKSVLNVKNGKMAAYAKIVEELVQKTTVVFSWEPNLQNCAVETCQWNLSDGYQVDHVTFGKPTAENAHENEIFPCESQEGILQRLLNHGSFKFVHCTFW